MAHILMVEDDPLMADLYMTVLTMSAHEVAHVNTGAEALTLLESTTPDLIILDLMMPKMSGIDTLKLIKANKTWSGIPVLIFSNLADQKYEQEAIEAGAARYALKSDYLPAAFLELVSSLLPAPRHA